MPTSRMARPVNNVRAQISVPQAPFRGVHSTTPPKGAALPRGKACLTCRRRKMRCDGVRPVCTQCKSGRREKDCEFDESRSKSRTQMLIENVSRLERRLQDLQRNGKSQDNFFHDDRTCTPSEEDIFDLSQFPFPEVKNMEHSVPPFYNDASAFPVTSGNEAPFLTQAPQWNDLAHSFKNQQTLGAELSVGAGWPLQQHHFNNGVPSEHLRSILLDSFLTHRLQLGIEDALQSGVGSSINGAVDQLWSNPPLLSVVLLWGGRFQNVGEELERNLLLPAMDEVAKSLNTGMPATSSAILATCLLATYLYACGRLIEGKYHADAAASALAAVDLNMNAHGLDASAVLNSSHGRTMLFWNVFELGSWSIATGTQSALLCGDDPISTIKTPWPVSRRSPLSQDDAVGLESLLASPQPMRHDEDPSSLRAKAVALLQMSHNMSAAFATQAHLATSADRMRYHQLELCITRSSACLGPLPLPPSISIVGDSSGGAAAFNNLVVVHSHLSAAMILLHRALAATNPTSQDKCQTWARKMIYVIEQIPDLSFSYLHPTMAICWALAAEVIEQEIAANKVQFVSQARLVSLEGELVSLKRALATLSRVYPIARQLSQSRSG